MKKWDRIPAGGGKPGKSPQNMRILETEHVGQGQEGASRGSVVPALGYLTLTLMYALPQSSLRHDNVPV